MQDSIQAQRLVDAMHTRLQEGARAAADGGGAHAVRWVGTSPATWTPIPTPELFWRHGDWVDLGLLDWVRILEDGDVLSLVSGSPRTPVQAVSGSQSGISP